MLDGWKFAVGLAFVMAQVPALDPGWGSYLATGGATAAVIFVMSVMTWFQAQERKADRAERRMTNICLLENAEQSARVAMMLEALAPFASKNIKPSESQKLNLQRVEALREDLLREKDADSKS
jgi:hypothetical protein